MIVCGIKHGNSNGVPRMRCLIVVQQEFQRDMLGCPVRTTGRCPSVRKRGMWCWLDRARSGAERNLCSRQFRAHHHQSSQFSTSTLPGRRRKIVKAFSCRKHPLYSHIHRNHGAAAPLQGPATNCAHPSLFPVMPIILTPPEIPRISLPPQRSPTHPPRTCDQQSLGLLWHPRSIHRLPYLLAATLHVHLLPSKPLHYSLPRAAYQDRISVALPSIRPIIRHRFGYQRCVHLLLCRRMVHGPRLQR